MERVCGYRVVVSVSVVCPHDQVARWELGLTATAQHHERGLNCVYLTRGKIQIQNSKCGLYQMRIALAP